MSRRGLSLGQIVMWYLGASVVVGILSGLLQPWADTRAKGAIVGFAISVPITLTYYFLLSKTVVTVPQLVVAVALIGITLGAPIGAMYWRE